MKFTCPNCAMPLSVNEAGCAKCRRGHSFDRSREGYYNLLLSSAGGVHGDNREMINARRRFLDTGAYLPLANSLVEQLRKYLGDGSAILDMGCGEGYYTDCVQRALDGCSVSAFDISKDAVRLAAKRNKRIMCAVASSYKIPAADSSFDAVFNVFSPLAESETKRVLKSGGIFLFAAPDKRHLWELKASVYDKPYENEPKSAELEGFDVLDVLNIKYTMSLSSSEEIQDLFMMTPYAYRTGECEISRLRALSALECRAEFLLFVYRKK